MKSVIREGVFETNSSRAPSLTLKGFDKKEGERCHFVVVSPLQKIILLRALVENSEQEYSNSKANLEYSLERKREIAEKTKEELRKELERRVAAEYERNGFTGGYFEPFSEADEGELVQFYKMFADEGEQKDELCAFFESVWYEDERKFTLAFLALSEQEYCKTEGISKEEFEKRIDDAPIHRGGRAFNGKMSVTCNRFFCEGALYDCNCGFGTYYEIAKAICSTLDLIKFKCIDEGIPEEKVRLFLSEEYCFACNEYYCGLGKDVELPPTDKIY